MPFCSVFFVTQCKFCFANIMISSDLCNYNSKEAVSYEI